MPLYQPFFPARYLNVLLAIRREAGVAPWPGMDAGAGASVPFDVVDRLMQDTIAVLGRRDIGFDMGRRITLDDHAALGPAIRQCRTLDEALRLVSRYYRIITNGFVFQYQRGAQFGEMVFRPAAPLSRDSLYAFEELFATAFHSDMLLLLGPRPGIEVFLSMPRPPHAERYRALRPTRFHFQASALPEARGRVPLALLDQPLRPGGGPAPAALALDDNSGRAAPSREYSKWVALILGEAEGVQPTLKELAGLLNISPRTLNRYLQAEGTTLRELNTAIRYERACQALAHSEEPVGQLAYRLGYASTVSFFIAFRKAAGVGPREYRERLRRDDAQAAAG